MKYSREKLDSFLDKPFDKNEYSKITQDLVNSVLTGEEVTLAEESFACSIIKLLRKPGTNELAYDITTIDSCKNYRFKNTYLQYFSDLNGNKIVRDAHGEIPIERKKIDVEFLEKEYISWKELINYKLNENNLIGHIARETQYQIKELHKYGKKRMFGSRFLNYLEKSLILHGKYIYLTVLESFQESEKDEFTFNFDNNEILIDSYSYVHTLFRHYSQSIKEHQLNKSYHFDENINFKKIPNFLLELLTCYTKSNNSVSFNKQNIYFQFNGKYYVVWLKKMTKTIKGGVKVDYLRVQTLYPVEHKEELEKIKKMKTKITNCGFYFFQ